MDTDTSKISEIWQTCGKSKGFTKCEIQSIDEGVSEGAGDVRIIFSMAEYSFNVVVEEKKLSDRIWYSHIPDLM